MYHELFANASFWSFLSAVDEDLANASRAEGCPCCGGRLHAADYPRKPRGGPRDLPDACPRRLSFCCARDGCRKRATPPSVRFLGRKVYLGAVVVLVAAMRQGSTPRRVRELSKHFGVDCRTIGRWRVFWDEHFPRTKFWHAARGRLVPVIEITALPRDLWRAFVVVGDDREGWLKLLRFLAPITITKGLEIKPCATRHGSAEDARRSP
jgi:hypothetical protein